MLDFTDPNAHTGEINYRYSSKNKSFYMSLEPTVARTNIVTKICIKSKYDYMKLTGWFSVIISPYDDYNYLPFKQYYDETIDVLAVNGTITFSYCFKSEQKYKITVFEKTDDEKMHLFLISAIYALDDDLFKLKPLIGDLHTHTIYSDGFESPENVVNGAIKVGLEFLAITDHNCFEGSTVAEKYITSHGLPLTIIHGEEYSSNFTNMHIISLGAKEALPQDYYKIKDTSSDGTQDVCKDIRTLLMHIKDNGGLSVLCHPLRKPLLPNKARTDVPDSILKELLRTNSFDAVEIVSGGLSSDSMSSTMQFLLANEYGSTPNTVAYVGSTDSHHYSLDPNCGKRFTMVFSTGNTEQEILKAIYAKKSVAIQVINQTNANCYGQLRYVRYALFLLKHKYNILD